MKEVDEDTGIPVEKKVKDKNEEPEVIVDQKGKAVLKPKDELPNPSNEPLVPEPPPV